MNRFQKFLHMVDGHEKDIFDFIEFFGSGHVLVIFLDLMDQKITRANKINKVKNQFFPARQPCKRIF